MNVQLKAGTSRVVVSFLNPYKDPKVVEKDKQDRLLVVRSIVVDGPYNAPAPKLPEGHQRIMAHQPDLKPREAAREIVARFATRAFRRPVQPAEVERFLKLYDKAEKERRPLREVRSRWPCAASSCRRTSCSASNWTRPTPSRGRLIRSASTSWPAGCRTSSGAACPTTSCSRWRRRASCGQNLEAAGPAHAQGPRSRRPSCRTSPGNG